MEWAVVSGAGAWRVEELGKRQLMRRTGLSARDLRAVDPVQSYPCSITGRDRAIVVNLERARAVITATEVLVPASRDPAVEQLVRNLQARLDDHASPAPPQTSEEDEAAEHRGALPRSPTGVVVGRDDEQASVRRDKVLPFELRALEVCLEFSCKSLEEETCTLEMAAYPAVDELTSNVSTLNLERMRHIKSRLLAISRKVQKVRDELEHLLDDDWDMAAMHLSDKLAYQKAAADGRSSRFDNSNNEPSDEFDEEDEKAGSSIGFTPKIDELENLLEAYFVQVDGTLKKLSHLREYVDDTEDYMNIMLDDKQNQLLRMVIMLSTATITTRAALIRGGCLPTVGAVGAAAPMKAFLL